MTDDIVQIIAQYGLETILIAVTVNILTALIKIPIKHFANKTKNSSRITRFIVILPLVIGFAITVCYMKFIAGNFTFGKEFVTLWLTSSSLSLTIYAVLEKMIPSKKTILKDSESEMTEKIIDKLQSIADGVFNTETKTEEQKSVEENADVSVEAESNSEEQRTVNETNDHISTEKIILRGNNHVQNVVEE